MMTRFLLFALTCLWLVGCASNPADNKPQAKVQDVPAEPVAKEVTGKDYQLTEASSVTFVGSKVTGSHTGNFPQVSGSVIVPEDGIEKGRVSIAIDMTSVETDAAKLTTHLKGPDFFDVEGFPESTFESTTIKKTDDGYEVTGNLTLHGETKAITFPATIAVSDEKVMATAEFSINRMDFGIQYPGKPDDLIREEVVIKLDVTATPAS